MTRRAIVMILALGTGCLSLGCRNVGGLCAARSKPRPDDPSYTIEEQKRRARDKYAIPDNDFRLGPNVYNDLPGGVGR